MTQYNAEGFKPHPDKVFVTELESGARKSKGGILMLDDVGKDHGLRPRWGQVWKVGSNVKDVKPGTWLLVEHGRWSLGIDLKTDDGEIRVWHIDFPDAIIVASEEDPRPEMVKL